MTTIPYVLVGQKVLGALGTGTFQYPVPQGEELRIRDLIYSSSGTFSITSIYTSDGQRYTNASGSAGIPSSVLANGANNFNNIRDFEPDLVIKGGTIFYIDLVDTSNGANTVNLAMNCQRDTK